MQSEAIGSELVPMLVCTQPPVISENLVDLQARVNSISEMVSKLPMNAESVPQVKKARADLRKYFETLEEQRKAVKAAVMAPYNEAEEKYKALVSMPIHRTDMLCKDFVNAVESSMKRECEDGLREYFDELLAANHVEFLKFEQAGIVVDMASAKQKTPKKLREQLAQFVARVASDVDRIAEMDDSEEIMVEYQKTLNVADSIGTVIDRHRRIQAQRDAASAREAIKAAEAAAVQKVEAVAPPVEVPREAAQETEKQFRCTFTVTATKPQLKRLKEFLNQEGIRYE